MISHYSCSLELCRQLNRSCYLEIVFTLIFIKVPHFVNYAFCSYNFHCTPSVALLFLLLILCSVFKVQFPTFVGGGDNRDRTDDPLLAKQVLSQLSYTPIFI